MQEIIQWATDYNDMKNQYESKVREYDKLKDSMEVYRKSMNEYKETLVSYQPFLFRSSSFIFNTGHFTFFYYGLTEGSYSITVRIIKQDGPTVSYARRANIMKGSISASVNIGRLHLYEIYCFELMYNGIVIGGGRH